MFRSMRTLCLLILSITLAASAPGLAGQVAPASPNQPPRDRPADAAATATIRGHVVDAATGAPLRRALVRLNAPGLREGRTTMTDAEGQYEFTDLVPGPININASRNGYLDASYGQRAPMEPGKPVVLTARQALDKVDFSLVHASVMTGRVLDEYGEPLADIQIMALRLSYSATGRRPTNSGRPGSSNDVGEFRLFGLTPGDYVISASSRQGNPAGVTDDRTGYAATYYPGTPILGQAHVLHLSVGQTLADLTIMLSPARVARVSGTVFDAQGQPVTQGSVTAIQLSDNTSMFVSAGFGSIRPDGTFVINGVAPGSYQLLSNAFGPPVNGQPPPEPSSATITVNGADLASVRLEVQPKLTIAGRVVVDPAATETPRLQNVRVAVNPRGPFFGPPSPVNELVQPDQTFQLQVRAGTSVVRLNGLPARWIVKEVRHRGMDVSEEIAITDNIDDLEIEVTNRISTVTGVVSGARNEPMPDVFAVFFPRRAEGRTPFGFGNGGMSRTDAEGKFTLGAVRPGEYYLAAVSHLENGQWMDPDFQASLIPSATLISVDGSGPTAINLTMSNDR
jgi:protocatechuate 3,4-dioxygenase beta subunit